MISRQIRIAQSQPSRLLLLLVLLVSAAQLARPQTFVTLYSFSGPDGVGPQGSLLLDTVGNLYGSTYQGGAHSRGTVYRLAPDGTQTILYSFRGAPDATGPNGGLIRDGQGNLYGTSRNNGGHLSGAVFRIGSDGTEKVLHAFTNSPDGNEPLAGLVRDTDGNLYGTTFYGGDQRRDFGHGVVFQLSPDGAETVLYTFTGGADGSHPDSALIRDAAGNLYGTTQDGGAFGLGTVFVVSPSGRERVLHNFAGGIDGAFPAGGLVRDGHGNLYGTCFRGGDLTCGDPAGCGIVFKLTPAGKKKTLYQFLGGDDGQYPYGLARDGKGNLFGTTAGGVHNSGTVFKLTPMGTKTLLYSFTGGSDGSAPSGVIRGKNGILYGVTLGGAFGFGTVFKVTP